MVKAKDDRSNNKGRPTGSQNKTPLKLTHAKMRSPPNSAVLTHSVTLTMRNLSEKVHPIESVVTHKEQEETVKSSEKPPEKSSEIQPPKLPEQQTENKTYRTVLTDAIEVDMVNPREKSTF